MKSSALKKITPSKENYLKVLLELSAKDTIRSTDVAKALGVTKASVSCMLNKLKQEGYVTKEKYGAVALTEKGCKEAENVRRRYNLLKTFLVMALGVDSETASNDACRLEHIISAESLTKINEFLIAWKHGV